MEKEREGADPTGAGKGYIKISPDSDAGVRVLWTVLIFAPLAFGAEELWSISLVEGGACLALFLFLMDRLRKGHSVVRVPGTVPMLLGLGYLLVQVIPLPPVIVKVVSPATWEIWTDPALGTLMAYRWMPLSVYPHATWGQFLRIAGYAVFYVAVVQTLSQSRHLKRTVTVVAVFAAILALFTIVQSLTANGKIFWLRTAPAGGSAGPFVNHNHWAGFMEMTIPLALALFLSLKPKGIYQPWRQRMAQMFSRDEVGLYLLLGFGVVLMAASVFWTLSRSGMVCLGISLIFFIFMLKLWGRGGGREFFVIGITSGILLFVSWLGWNPIIQRFDRLLNEKGEIADTRPVVWRDSRAIITDFPVTGTGLGTFQTIFPTYRTLPGNMRWVHAHSDYLEIPADTGIIGFFLGLWFMAAVIYKTFQVIRNRREPLAIFLFVGSLTGIFSILCHSATDFNLQVGSNGLYFVFLLGLAVSAAHTRHRLGYSPTLLQPAMKPAGHLWMAAAIFLFIGVIWGNGQRLVGDYYRSYIDVETFNDEHSEEKWAHMGDLMDRALRWDTSNALNTLYAGEIAWRRQEVERAAGFYDQCVGTSPAYGEAHLARALFFAAEKPDTPVDAMFTAAMRRYPVDPGTYREYGRWLFSQDRRTEATDLITRAMAADPGDDTNTHACLAILIVNGFSKEAMAAVLPDRVAPRLIYAQYLAAIDDASAGDAYLSALEAVSNEPKAASGWFMTAGRYFMMNKRDEEGLRVLQRGVEALPDDAGLRVQLAQRYEKAGILYRAREEYEQALFIDPRNKSARKRLDALTDKP